MLLGFAGTLLAWMAGAAWVAVFRPRDLAFAVTLGIGAGLGLTSLIWFWTAWLMPGAWSVPVAAEVLLCAGGLLLARRRWNAGAASMPADSPVSGNTKWFVAMAGVVAGLAVAAFLVFSRIAPHGEWDAWAIWNLRARFLFRTGSAWRDSFSPLLASSHPDYPLLLPLSVARSWFYSGSDQPVFPITVAFLFTFGTIALVGTALWRLRGAAQGALAAGTLLAAAGFIRAGATQYADVPLSFFAAGALLCLALAEREQRQGSLLLAGFCAGLAAWTKNEGLLFAGALLVGRAAGLLKSGQARELGREALLLLAGAALPLAALGAFKIGLAPPTDVVTGVASGGVGGRLADPGRIWLVLYTFGEQFWKLGNATISVVLLLPVAWFCLGRWKDASPALLTTGLTTILLTLLGFAAVYLSSPNDLSWYMGTSLPRLLVQLWPLAVALFFLTVNAPAAVAREVPRKPVQPKRAAARR